MRHTWMVWLGHQDFVENISRFLLVGIGLIGGQRRSQKPQSIENSGLAICWVAEIELFHCFLIGDCSCSMIELVRIFEESVDRGNIIPLLLRSRANNICPLHRRRSVA